MAEAIPKVEWSESEEYLRRLFYWDYLVRTWLVPGHSVMKDPGSQTQPLQSLSSSYLSREHGWLMEPEKLVEQ